ncbi:MAG: ABC transporter permease [Renibacterium sp.]|nr:ABC transporter permease [Renibacterium sp.]
MSHAIATAPARTSSAGTHGLSFIGVLRSESIKFWTLLSTKLLLAVTFVAMVGIGSLAAWLRATAFTEMTRNVTGPNGEVVPSGLTLQQVLDNPPRGLEISGIPVAGLQIGVLILGALAVLFIASEYGTGMIRSTFAAVPGRIQAFLAKAVVLVVVSYVLTLVAAFVTFALAVPILNGYNIEISLSQNGVLQGILLGGLYVAGVAVIGLSLGVLLRSSAGAIIVVMALMFVLPFAAQAAQLIPGEFWKHVQEYLPSFAGGRMLEVTQINGLIDPGVGGLIFLAWIALFTIPAMIVLKRRDA